MTFQHQISSNLDSVTPTSVSSLLFFSWIVLCVTPLCRQCFPRTAMDDSRGTELIKDRQNFAQHSYGSFVSPNIYFNLFTWQDHPNLPLRNTLPFHQVKLRTSISSLTLHTDLLILTSSAQVSIPPKCSTVLLTWAAYSFP